MKTSKCRFFALSLLTVFAAGCTYEYSMDKNSMIGKARVDTKGYEDYGGVNVSNAYIPVDWKQEGTDVVDYDTLTGKCHITLANMEDAMKIGKGSIMTLDTDSLIYLRRVVKAEADENGLISIETESVSLPELFPESRFEIHICPEDSIDAAPTRSANGDMIFYPSAIREKDAEGHWVETPLYGDGEMTRADGTDKKEDYVGLKTYKTTKLISHSKSVHTFTFNLFSGNGESHDVGAEVSVEYGKKEINDYKLGFNLHLLEDSSLEFVKLTESWDTTKVSIKATSEWANTTGDKMKVAQFNAKKSKDNFANVRKNLATIPSGIMLIAIGPVPVEIQFIFNVELEIGLGLTGNVEVAWETIEHIEGKAEGIYVDGKGIQLIHDKGTDTGPGTDFKKLMLEGSALGKCAVKPRLDVLFYSAIGPYVGLSAKLECGINAGVGLSIPEDTELTDKQSSNIVTGYELSLSKGLDLNVGMGLNQFVEKFLNLKGFRDKLTLAYQIKPMEPILKTPGSIKCMTKLATVKVNEENLLEFKILTDRGRPHIIPYVMHFKAGEGELVLPADIDEDDGFAMSSAEVWKFTSPLTGTANVIWTPTDKKSKLTAYYTTYDGDYVTCSIAPDTSPDGCIPIDMGTSCLWAPMNVGAYSQLSAGDYVGWGDASGKHWEQGCSSDATYAEDADLLKYYGGLKAAKNISGTTKDYARSKWGGSWRMPTKDEWKELISKCDWHWSESTHSYKVTNRSNPNNYIYLPANGCRIGQQWVHVGESCEYWSANLYTKNSTLMDAYYFSGQKNRVGGKDLNYDYHTPRYMGQGVRAVIDKENY